jgi:hypothetical protein
MGHRHANDHQLMHGCTNLGQSRTFALVVVMLLATGVVAGAATAARGVVQSNPTVVTNGMMRSAGWIAFAGTVLAWIVTEAGSFRGEAQARNRGRALRLAA